MFLKQLLKRKFHIKKNNLIGFLTQILYVDDLKTIDCISLISFISKTLIKTQD